MYNEYSDEEEEDNEDEYQEGEYFQDNYYLQNTYERIKQDVQPGDIVMPKEFDRGNGTAIIGLDKSMVNGIIAGNGQIHLPPWVTEFGMSNGFTFEEIISIYVDTSITLILYPKSLQGEDLKIRNGYAISLRAYDPDRKETIVIHEEDEWYYDDIDSPLTEELFLDEMTTKKKKKKYVRKFPKEYATKCKVGQRMIGQDGKMYEVELGKFGNRWVLCK